MAGETSDPPDRANPDGERSPTPATAIGSGPPDNADPPDNAGSPDNAGPTPPDPAGLPDPAAQGARAMPGAATRRRPTRARAPRVPRAGVRTPPLGTAAPGELPALDDFPDQRIQRLDDLGSPRPAAADDAVDVPVMSRGTSAETVRQVELSSGMLASRAAARMGQALPWFATMSASHRAGIQLVVQAGISSFVEWCRRPEHARELSEDVFRVAPRELVRAVTFRRLVDLVRVAVEAIEAEVPNLAGPDQEQLLLADVLRYSRDIAFAGAVVYARAAEERGAWDARLEALVVDHVVRGEVDRALPSRAAAVGWRNPPAVTVIVGRAGSDAPEVVVDEAHRLARLAGLEVLAGVHHDRLVMVVGGRFETAGDGIGRPQDAPADAPGAPEPAVAGVDGGPRPGAGTRAAGAARSAGAGGAGPGGAGDAPSAARRRGRGSPVHTELDAARALMAACGPGPVVVGPVVNDLTKAPRAARIALAATDVVAAWPAAPRPVLARALLPELALAGDADARRALIEEVYLPLRDAGTPLLETAGAYLDFGSSLEATARALYLHTNTVRYRLRKAAEVCGLDPVDHRERFILHVALVLGRLDGALSTGRP